MNRHPALPRPLRGIIPPLATPLLENDRLDHAGLERLIEHVLAGGVHGLFVLGSTGEAPGLSCRLRRELIERTCEHVKGRVPILVGVTDPSFVEAVETAEFAADAGAAGVVHAGPYYFPIAQPELATTFENLAAALPLPLFLYNMPSHTKVNIEPDTVRRLLEVPNIHGIKDSSGQMVAFRKLVQIAKARPDFSVLIGPEELLAEAIFLGAHGGVTGGANLDPALYVKLYDAARNGDLALARELSAKILRISMTIYATGKYWSSYLQGMKCALACMGICTDVLAEPFERFGPAEKAVIEKHVRELGLVVAKPLAV
jgi:dihydrodipicolinate synthase/N-acetylneuraminate lyase